MGYHACRRPKIIMGACYTRDRPCAEVAGHHQLLWVLPHGVTLQFLCCSSSGLLGHLHTAHPITQVVLPLK
jgi:hypothetical protein